MALQEVKIEFNDFKVFFFRHSLKTAMQHAEEFIERNRGKFDMKVFILNTGHSGTKWIYQKTISK